MTTGEVDYWNDVATRSWGRYISDVERSFLLRVTANEAPGALVDVGCGAGRWSALLAGRGWSVTGVDVDPEALNRARDRMPDGTFEQVDPGSRRLPVADASATLVICVEVLAAVGSSWFLPEVRRVLAPGGVLVATVWNRASLRGVAATGGSRVRHGVPHPFYSSSYRTWRAEAQRHAMTVTEAEGLCWGPFGRASDSPLVPAVVRAERGLRLHRLPALSPWVLVAARRT